MPHLTQLALSSSIFDTSWSGPEYVSLLAVWAILQRPKWF